MRAVECGSPGEEGWAYKTPLEEGWECPSRGKEERETACPRWHATQTAALGWNYWWGHHFVLSTALALHLLWRGPSQAVVALGSQSGTSADHYEYEDSRQPSSECGAGTWQWGQPGLGQSPPLQCRADCRCEDWFSVMELHQRCFRQAEQLDW